MTTVFTRKGHSPFAARRYAEQEKGSVPFLVEAAGIEPASEKVRTRASTRLADSVFYVTFEPLSGKWIEGQPVSFAYQLQASPESYPQLSSPR